MDIADELVGRRVSLRYRVGERDGRPLYRDAVGELSTDETGADETGAAGTGTVLVKTRRGPVRVARAAVVAVRAVPPAPPRRAPLTAIARLEELCATAWPAQVDRRLGGWRLRAAGGYTARANSALAVGDPGVPVPVALDVVRGFAREHGIPPRVQVPLGSPWDRAVAERGWVLDAGHAAGAEVAVLVARLDAAAADTVSDDTAPRIELPERPSEAWWRLCTGRPPTPAQRHVLDPGGDPRTAFALVRDPDQAAVGQLRATVVQDHLHLSWLQVVPGTSRRGLATALLAAVAGWGHGHGARWAVLQVAVRNEEARACYAQLRFREHHRYRYLVPPPG